ncbi:DUF7710 domain-containing protein [Azovibrio restrictus]|uniref:DUF7710 domain-containing protein n=1 Tax=Azovibrio restrictus TaxID=146938 RepID=UPI000A0731F3|nr:hypothetical protein [Azovibrio restrictus]
MKDVWVFNGVGGKFPSAIFDEQADAEKWIKKNSLTGVLTRYPVGVSVYDWAIENNHFFVGHAGQKSSDFIQKFSSAAQEHIHFENGSSD